MAERTDVLMQRLEDMHGKFAASMSTVNNLDFHVKRLQETIEQTKNSYAVVHRFMLNHVRHRRSSSGSGTPRSDGGGTSRSVSQSSLQQMLEESANQMNQRVPPEPETSDRELSDTTDAEHDAHKLGVPSSSGLGIEEPLKASSQASIIEGFKLDSVNSTNARKSKVQGRRSKGRLDSESGSSLGRASRERKLSGGRKSSIRKSSRSNGDAKAFSPSNKVCFRDLDDSDSGDGDARERKLSVEEEMHIRYMRSMSAPDEAAALHSPIKYERSLSTSSSRPVIQVIPPSSPPAIFTFGSEYTSLADELETVCMSRLSPPPSPHMQFPGRRMVSQLRRRHFSENVGISITVSSNPLRDAEEADYQLMEGLIQRRMHRDSENLAVSLEDLCSVKTEHSDTEDGTSPALARRDSRASELRKRHSTTSIDNNPSELLSVPGSIHLPFSPASSPTFHHASLMQGDGVRLTSSQPGSPNTRRSSLNVDMHNQWASSGALPALGARPRLRSSPRPCSPPFIRPQTSVAEYGIHSDTDPQPSDTRPCMATLQVPVLSETEARPKDKVTETEC